jgi:4-hydroxy-tetrahydrodipicolinate synthase
MNRYAGLFWVLATPFDEDGALDVGSLRQLVRFGLEKGVSGLTALGVTGEADYLTEEERSRVIDIVVRETGGAVPIVVGVSDPSTSTAAKRAARAQAAGAAAALVAVPPHPDRLTDHLGRIAEAAPGLDLVLQDYPASGHPQVTVERVAESIAAVPAVAAVKAEDPPTAPKITALLERQPGFPQFGGLGGLWVVWELRAGSAGTMTGFAFPEALVAVTAAAARGDWEEADRAYQLALPALVWEGQPGVALALRKVLLAQRRVIKTSRLRAPSIPAPTATSEASTLLSVGRALLATR